MKNAIAQTEPRPIRYTELIASNKNFRNLWFGQVVSELGDWLATVALLNIMLELTGKAQVLGWFFIIIFLPSVILGPACGVLIDRLDRKKLMIAMDLARAVIVLGYLLVRRADQIWMIYLIAALEVAMMTLFEPARTAMVPNVCSTRELVAANALSSITWSAMLTIGAAVGGFVAAALGRDICYLFDSLSFLLSAFFIARVRLQPAHSAARPQKAGTSGFREIREGFSYIKAYPRVLALALVKAGWGLGGGILLILSVFGEKIFPLMGSGAAGIGALYAARGIGAGLGPILARRMVGDQSHALRRAITAGFFLCSVAYVVFSRAPVLPIAALALMTAHMGGSVTWVFSTVLLQIEVPDNFRGRVFALELALHTFGIAVSNYVTGYLLDIIQLDARTVAALLGIYFAIPGICWLSAQRLYKA